MNHLSLDFAAAIGPEGYILGQQVHQRGHLTGLSSVEKTGEQLLVRFGRSWEPWSIVGKMFLCPAELLATDRFTLAEKGGNFRVVILSLYSLIIQYLSSNAHRPNERCILALFWVFLLWTHNASL